MNDNRLSRSEQVKLLNASYYYYFYYFETLFITPNFLMSRTDKGCI